MAKNQIATFLGPNKGLATAGNRCYAYSGAVSSAAGGGSFDGKVFDFYTGKHVTRINLNYSVGGVVTNDVYVKIKLNDVEVINIAYADPSVLNLNGNLPWTMIIPPLTHFVMDWGIDTVTKNLYAIIEGTIDA